MKFTNLHDFQYKLDFPYSYLIMETTSTLLNFTCMWKNLGSYSFKVSFFHEKMHLIIAC